MKLSLRGLLLLASLAAPIAAAQNPIQHVVVIFQENRTPDNLFHGLPGADIANTGLDSKGNVITLTAVPLANRYGMDHTHADFTTMYDGGKMDGADKIPVVCAPGAKNCPPPNPAFKYVTLSDVAPYFQLAEQYTFADRMFQTNQGPSFPAHQFIISGTSAPTATSDLFAAEEPGGITGAIDNSGCTAPQQERVKLIDPSGGETMKMYPCFDHPTLTDLLDTAGISWRYYTPSANFVWTGPNAISHIRFGNDWNNVIVNPAQLFTDIANNQLPGVSWVIPTGAESDHPRNNRGMGPSWVASIVNTIGQSQDWSSTAIFITWDDWGGWYDHVPPTIYDSYEYGFRVPLILVSPYARQGYVSKATHDFGSILKFIEQVYNLPSLGYADARADDFADCFEFAEKPHEFHPIQAPYDANYFINVIQPPGDPDDD
ncbi:MAG TPA: alkaline phosphatase family protein [Terriglobales bacterium]|nr:alkaline phosphatase family protein [Terriglobales bacterium]